MIERLRLKETAVKRASIQVTERVFMRQKDLRTTLLGQIELAGVQEKNTLRQWKKIIASITHPRLVYVISVYYQYTTVYYQYTITVYY